MENHAPTILVVDDEEPVRQFMIRLLSQAGYRAIAAKDVEQALGVLDEKSVDLILLDLYMPGPYDGEELLFLLRDRGDDVPIVVVSGWVDDEATIHHPECVHAVLKKPIQIDTLLDTVRQVLSGCGPGKSEPDS